MEGPRDNLYTGVVASSGTSQRPSSNESTDSTAGQPNHLISPPAITVPKDGGSIRGIDEKFAFNPATGTATLTVPIFTSPSRQGFHPQLTLSYDSGAGNGTFGLGWSLSVPRISRKTDKGIPRYQDAGETDTFILSGAEDLVHILLENDGCFYNRVLILFMRQYLLPTFMRMKDGE